MSEFTKPIEDVGRQAKDYVDLRLADIKLRLVKGLSTALGKIVYVQILMLVLSVLLIALAVGGVLLLGELIGSYTSGAFIMAGIFAVVILALYLLRDKLFKNTFVPMFAKLFFDDEEDDHETE